MTQQVQQMPEAQEEVTFWCFKYHNLKLRYTCQPAQVVWDGSRQVLHETPEQYIVFAKNLYTTSDPAKIDFIRKHPNFTGVSASGEEDKILIKEMPKPNKEALQLYSLIQQRGPAVILNALKNAPVQQQPVQQDPVMATALAQVQQVQGAPQNAGNQQSVRSA
jgi:hypothetical protein